MTLELDQTALLLDQSNTTTWSLTYDFAPRAPERALSAPDDLWRTFGSVDYDYVWDLPEGWVFYPRPVDGQFERYSGPEWRSIWVDRYYEYADQDPNEVMTGVGDWWVAESGVTFTSTETLSIAGAPAMLIVGTDTDEAGVVSYVQVALIAVDPVAQFEWWSPAGKASVDTAMFRDFVEGLVFAGLDQPIPPTSGGGDREAASPGELEVGACFQSSLPGLPGSSLVLVADVELGVVDCAEPHQGEVIGQLAPGTATTCEEVFAQYLGRELDDSSLGLVAIMPDPSQSTTCVAIDPAESLTGSVEGSEL
jgi:hypothetical protein